MIKLTVTENNTVLDYCLEHSDYSRSKLKSFLKHQCIYVNETLVTKHDAVVRKGDTIEIMKYNHQLDSLVEVLYEDEDVIAIFKPAGLLSISNTKESLHTAYRYTSDYLKQQDPKNRVFIVHRLDQETSGVLLFAKHKKAQEILQENWTTTRRIYTAVVEGEVKETKPFDVNESIDDTQPHRVFTGNQKGKEAHTIFTPVASNQSYSLLTAELDTGRKHQIRAHLEHIGHPITGDKRYGAKNNPFKRLGLHGSYIAFKHPKNRQTIKVYAKMPKSFSTMFKVYDTQIKQTFES